MLERAIRIATEAHAGQFDRGGKPYILHPLRIMNELLFDYELAAIGVMHDVLEDSNVTLQDLKMAGMSVRIMDALDLMDHRPEDGLCPLPQGEDRTRACSFLHAPVTGQGTADRYTVHAIDGDVHVSVPRVALCFPLKPFSSFGLIVPILLVFYPFWCIGYNSYPNNPQE